MSHKLGGLTLFIMKQKEKVNVIKLWVHTFQHQHLDISFSLHYPESGGIHCLTFCECLCMLSHTSCINLDDNTCFTYCLCLCFAIATNCISHI